MFIAAFFPYYRSKQKYNNRIDISSSTIFLRRQFQFRDDTTTIRVTNNNNNNEQQKLFDSVKVLEAKEDKDTSFQDIGIDKRLEDALKDCFRVCVPNRMQLKAIPLVLEQQQSNNDEEKKMVLVVSQTGSGKTLTFILPILQKILSLLKNNNNNLFGSEDDDDNNNIMISSSSINNKSTSKDQQQQEEGGGTEQKILSPIAIILAPTIELAYQHQRGTDQLLQHIVMKGKQINTAKKTREPYLLSTTPSEFLMMTQEKKVDAILYGNNHGDDSKLTQQATTMLDILRMYQQQQQQQSPININFLQKTS